MTVIAYRDGVLAADTLAVRGDSKIGHMVKIAKAPDGRLGAAGGDAGVGAAWLAWVAGGFDGDRPLGKSDDKYVDMGIVVELDGAMTVYEGTMMPFTITGPYFAIGCGSPEAMGAMHAGASAVQAVEAAIAHDVHCGGCVMTLCLGA